MKVGVRAHDYGRMGIKELAALLHEEGYEAAQLALPKAFQEINSYEDITLKKLEQIRTAFEEQKVDIPVFGCYMDLGNPDDQVREYAVKTLKTCLSLGKELGAKVVGTETAYPHLSAEERLQWKPYMRDSILRVMEEAVRVDMRLAVEPVWWHPLEDLETTLDIVKRVGDEAHLRLIFDASNLLKTPEDTDQDAAWSTWLEAVGAYVDVMHIKDFTLGAAGEYQPEVLGAGVMKYDAVSRWLAKQNREIYLLREEMNPQFAKEDIAFMRKL
ncbi:MAG: sugar phosphate isomerase/epimerase family protein [Lachnospiraceae bacterium]|nr:sugar phosphate isomerase/epimerase family protein [Lachnospiraceae bacterium]